MEVRLELSEEEWGALARLRKDAQRKRTFLAYSETEINGLLDLILRLEAARQRAEFKAAHFLEFNDRACQLCGSTDIRHTWAWPADWLAKVRKEKVGE